MILSPVSRFYADFTPTGDKSVTQRAILLGSVSNGVTIIKNFGTGKDCFSALTSATALGATYEINGNTLVITGVKNLEQNVFLPCGNSATTMRLYLGLLSGLSVRATLTGDESLSSRPMDRVLLPLKELGAKVEKSETGIEIYPSELTGKRLETSVPSAQVKSALLFAGLSAKGETVISERILTRDHTERMLPFFGAEIKRNRTQTTVKKCNLSGAEIDVPADFSTGAYFLALGALKGEATVKNVSLNPTRTGFLRLLSAMGAKAEFQAETVFSDEPRGTVRIKKSQLSSVDISVFEFGDCIDEIPLLAITCAYANGKSRIRNAEELRVKESNRFLSVIRMINALGGQAYAEGNSIIIDGKPLKGGVTDSFGDHRMAMCASVALCASENGGEIKNANACEISCPEFFEKLREYRIN